MPIPSNVFSTSELSGEEFSDAPPPICVVAGNRADIEIISASPASTRQVSTNAGRVRFAPKKILKMDFNIQLAPDYELLGSRREDTVLLVCGRVLTI